MFAFMLAIPLFGDGIDLLKEGEVVFQMPILGNASVGDAICGPILTLAPKSKPLMREISTVYHRGDPTVGSIGA